MGQMEDMRREFEGEPFGRANTASDPFAQFERWFIDAADANEGAWYEPNAMTLATAGEDGAPDARIVLLKSFDARGFVFYTNYASAKGQQLAGRAQAAAVFYWAGANRQVRIRGRVETLSEQTSREYFARRPRGSQIGAAVSRQSEPIESREVLQQRLADMQARLDGQPVPMPEHWGGYRIVPDEVEFWQGQPNRLHDRLLYARAAGGGWGITRLSP
jgi:pyridoxamine 5'-phosphate oxidase